MSGRAALAIALALVVAMPATAQVTPDASLGTNVNFAGQTWSISGGTVVGGTNQFHSFSQFDVGASQIADFTGSAGIANIVSRVTGSAASTINGTIHSSIDGANLWIINPHGIVFGLGSSLDVSGSFHGSSADYLQLEGGGQFFADPLADSVLTIGNPAAFGFLQLPTGNIVLNATTLTVPAGEMVSLVGHEVWLQNGARLTASGGRLNLASVGSAGEVALLADGIDNAGIAYTGNERVWMNGQSTLDVSGAGGGSIYIRGGQFRMGGAESDDETIAADTLGVADGGVVDVDVAGDVTVQGVITANTLGSGAGGDIRISGQNIFMPVRLGGINGQAEIETRADAAGNAGSIFLTASSISLDGSLRVGSTSSGDAGNIRIAAGTMNVNSLDAITSSTTGEGAGGSIDIDVQGQLGFQAGNIRAETSGAVNGGAAGDITINADRIANTGAFSISTTTSGSGTGGNVLLDAGSQIAFDNGTITSSATSSGNGGSVTLRAATGSITLEQNVDGDSVALRSTASDAGAAGSIALEADVVTIRGEASVSAETTGAGSAGSVGIAAASLFDLTGPATLDSRSRGATSGAAGTIAIAAGDVSIVNGASISVSTESDNVANAAGRIDIAGTQSVTIDNGLGVPALSATTSGGSAGGSIFVSGPVVAIDDSLIRSSTSGAGSAGSIDITGGTTLDLFGSILEAGTNGTGNGGSISLAGGDITVDGFTDLLANTSGTAQAGDIAIDGENVNVLTAFVEAAAGLSGTGGNIDFTAASRLHVGDAASVIATTQGSGAGGTITLDAPDTLVDGQAVVSAETSGEGTGGSVQVLGGNLSVAGDASLLATTSGAGSGGVVSVDNSSVVVEGNGSISGNTTGNGTGGTVDIASDDVLVHEGGSISAATQGSGAGGNVLVDAAATRVIDGGRISAGTAGSGLGGNIEIGGGLLTVANGGRIEATTSGDGMGGSLRIAPDDVMLGPGGVISVNATGAGDAGAIDIDAGKSVFLDNARVESTSALSNGGDIAIDAGNLIRLRDSEIFASGAPVASGSPGNAGNIRLGRDADPDSPAFLLFEGVHVGADAGGSGGAINVFARYMLGADYVFDAHSDTGNDGDVTIHVPATDFVSVLSQLELPVLNAAGLLDDQCAVSALSDRSSFVIDTVGLPPSPEDYQGSGYYLPAAQWGASLALPGAPYLVDIARQPGC